MNVKINPPCLLIILLFLGSGVYATQKDSILIKNVNIIPMTKEIVLENQNILIVNGRINKINIDSLKVSSEKIVDGTGKYLIPGLSEMHYHWRDTKTGIERDFKLLIANGITTARNMAEYYDQDHVAVKEKIESGAILGPDYYTTGPYLKSQQLQSKPQIDSVVTAHIQKKYDYIKLADNLTQDLYLHLLKTAQENSIPIIGHAQRKLPLEFSLRMKSIEHLEEFVYVFNKEEDWNYLNYDISTLNSVAKQIRESGSYITPTLVVFESLNHYLDDKKFEELKKDSLVKYLPVDQKARFLTEWSAYRKMKNIELQGVKVTEIFKKYLKWMKLFTRILSDNNVRMMSGSDTFGVVYVGFSLHREFEMMQEIGIRPYDILRMSTITPARYLNKYAEEGTITEGKIANLVLLNKNPLEDITHSKTIESVILRGKLFDRKMLDKLLLESEIN